MMETLSKEDIAVARKEYFWLAEEDTVCFLPSCVNLQLIDRSSSQLTSYRDPLMFVRGERQYLFDENGERLSYSVYLIDGS